MSIEACTPQYKALKSLLEKSIPSLAGLSETGRSRLFREGAIAEKLLPHTMVTALENSRVVYAPASFLNPYRTRIDPNLLGHAALGFSFDFCSPLTRRFSKNLIIAFDLVRDTSDILGGAAGIALQDHQDVVITRTVKRKIWPTDLAMIGREINDNKGAELYGDHMPISLKFVGRSAFAAIAESVLDWAGEKDHFLFGQLVSGYTDYLCVMSQALPRLGFIVDQTAVAETFDCLSACIRHAATDHGFNSGKNLLTPDIFDSFDHLVDKAAINRTAFEAEAFALREKNVSNLVRMMEQEPGDSGRVL